MKIEDIDSLWEREKHLVKKEREHRQEKDADVLIHDTHEPIHHSHEPEMLTKDPHVHEMDPPTKDEVAAARELHRLEGEAEDILDDYETNSDL